MSWTPLLCLELHFFDLHANVSFPQANLSQLRALRVFIAVELLSAALHNAQHRTQEIARVSHRWLHGRSHTATADQSCHETLP